MELTNEEIRKIQLKVLVLIKEVERICAKHKLAYSIAYGSVLGAVRHKGFIPWDTDMDIIIPVTEVENFRKIFEQELPKNMRIIKWEQEKGYHPCFDRVVFKNLPHEIYHIDVYPLCGLPSNVDKRKYFIKECYYKYHILSCRIKNPSFSKEKNIWKIKLIKKMLFMFSEKRIKEIYYELQHRYKYENSNDVYTITSIYRMRDYTNKDNLLDVTKVLFEDVELPIPKKYHEYLSSIYGDYMIPKKY